VNAVAEVIVDSPEQSLAERFDENKDENLQTVDHEGTNHKRHRYEYVHHRPGFKFFNETSHLIRVLGVIKDIKLMKKNKVKS
jgi:hypothetical protein